LVVNKEGHFPVMMVIQSRFVKKQFDMILKRLECTNHGLYNNILQLENYQNVFRLRHMNILLSRHLKLHIFSIYLNPKISTILINLMVKFRTLIIQYILKLIHIHMKSMFVKINIYDVQI